MAGPLRAARKHSTVCDGPALCTERKSTDLDAKKSLNTSLNLSLLAETEGFFLLNALVTAESTQAAALVKGVLQLMTFPYAGIVALPTQLQCYQIRWHRLWAFSSSVAVIIRVLSGQSAALFQN